MLGKSKYIKKQGIRFIRQISKISFDFITKQKLN